MKVAEFIAAEGTKSAGEVCLILNKEEAQIIVCAVEDFAQQHQRSGKVKRVLKDLRNVPCF